MECGLTGKHYPADQLHGLSEVGRPLLVRYDLDALKFAVTKEDLAARAPEFWRYREFLPVRRSENVIRLGEVMTPLVSAPALQSELGCGEILVKEEGRLPTGSFKARGLALAVSMAKELGGKHLAMPTYGYAGARTWRVNGLIDDCGRIVGEGKEAVGWVDISTLKEPYRIEGKKTMGLELAEQMDWALPDVILYLTGGGQAVQVVRDGGGRTLGP